MPVLVTPDSNLEELDLDQVNWLLDEAGEPMTANTSVFVQVNASDEAQYELTYWSDTANTLITNHAFVEFDDDGDPVINIFDFGDEELIEEAPEED